MLSRYDNYYTRDNDLDRIEEVFGRYSVGPVADKTGRFKPGILFKQRAQAEEFVSAANPLMSAAWKMEKSHVSKYAWESPYFFEIYPGVSEGNKVYGVIPRGTPDREEFIIRQMTQKKSKGIYKEMFDWMNTEFEKPGLEDLKITPNAPFPPVAKELIPARPPIDHTPPQNPEAYYSLGVFAASSEKAKEIAATASAIVMEMFEKLGVLSNLADASKPLFVHRNTEIRVSDQVPLENVVEVHNFFARSVTVKRLLRGQDTGKSGWEK